MGSGGAGGGCMGGATGGMGWGVCSRTAARSCDRDAMPLICPLFHRMPHHATTARMEHLRKVDGIFRRHLPVIRRAVEKIVV